MPTPQKGETAGDFNQTAGSPPPAPQNAGLGQGMSIPLNDVMKIALHHADLVHIGDVNHQDFTNSQLIAQPETLKGFAEAGTTHLFLELPQKLQQVADDFAAHRINEDQFDKELDKLGFDSDKTAFADMILGGPKLGIKVHCADPDTGKNELAAAAYALGVAGKDKQGVEETAFAFYTSYESREDRAEVTAALLGIKPEEAEALWKQDNNSLDSPVLARLKEGYAALSKVSKEDATARVRDAYALRTGDSSLAAHVADNLHGEKGVMFYGDAHGSQNNDFNEKLAALGVSSLKITVYPNREAYEKAQEDFKKSNEGMGTHFGEDPPELIYIESEQKLYTTPKTPPDVAADLAKLGRPVADAAPAPQQPAAAVPKPVTVAANP